MKKLSYISLLIVIFFLTAFAQNNSSCPKVEFKSPISATVAGDVMVFEISLTNEIKDVNLEYNWTVSSGQILSGQGTSLIKVATTRELEEQNITAIVEIKGFPENCPSKFSESGFVVPITGDYFPDEYGKISLKEEFTRFDELFTRLANVPNSRGFVLMEISENERFIDAKKHIQKIMQFGVGHRGYDKSWLIFAIKKSTLHRTEHILVLKDEDLPKCENCEIIKGSDINLKKPRKTVKR